MSAPDGFHNGASTRAEDLQNIIFASAERSSAQRPLAGQCSDPRGAATILIRNRGALRPTDDPDLTALDAAMSAGAKAGMLFLKSGCARSAFDVTLRV